MVEVRLRLTRRRGRRGGRPQIGVLVRHLALVDLLETLRDVAAELIEKTLGSGRGSSGSGRGRDEGQGILALSHKRPLVSHIHKGCQPGC